MKKIMMIVFMFIFKPVFSQTSSSSTISYFSPPDTSTSVSTNSVIVGIPYLNETFDLSSFLQQLRPAYVFDQHHQNLEAVYEPLVDFHTASGLSMVQIDLGAVIDPVTNIGGMMVAVPFNTISLADRIFTNTWIKNHVSIAKLPNLELGPYGSWSGTRLGWTYGGFVAYHLGK